MVDAESCGFSVPLAFFFLFYSTAIPIPALTVVVGLVGVLGYERLLTRWSARGFNDVQKLGLAIGCLGFFIVFDIVFELNGVSGMGAVGLGFFLLILKLRSRVEARLHTIPRCDVSFAPVVPA